MTNGQKIYELHLCNYLQAKEVLLNQLRSNIRVTPSTLPCVAAPPSPPSPQRSSPWPASPRWSRTGTPRPGPGAGAETPAPGWWPPASLWSSGAPASRGPAPPPPASTWPSCCPRCPGCSSWRCCSTRLAASVAEPEDSKSFQEALNFFYNPTLCWISFWAASTLSTVLL